MQVTLELNNPSQSFLDSLTKLVTSAGGSISFFKDLKADKIIKESKETLEAYKAGKIKAFDNITELKADLLKWKSSILKASKKILKN